MDRLYAGIDLHSNNSFLAIIDEQDWVVFKKRLPNDAASIIGVLELFRENMVGVVVESTFNWYWLVDALMDAGFKVHLANPAGNERYKGLKHSDDGKDAVWLAHLLRIGLLAEGFIYPREERPIRDLLRQRCHLVHLRTSLILSLQGIIQRNCGRRIDVNKIKQFKEDNISPLLAGQDDLELSGRVSKDAIDTLTRQIRTVETALGNKVKLKPQFAGLQTLPGVGKILGLTITLETGDIRRFAKVGNFTSYCRKTPTVWTSNDKRKGQGNKKNGNKYLSWAFSEAADFARRHDEDVKKFYNRKAAKTNCAVAHGALAHKLARAAYFIMRDGIEYEPTKLFA